MSARERFLHPYKECFVLLPNRCGISSLQNFKHGEIKIGRVMESSSTSFIMIQRTQMPDIRDGKFDILMAYTGIKFH